MNRRHVYIEMLCAEAHAEIRAMSQIARDALIVKVGRMLRSAGQIRRFGTAKEHLLKGD